MSQQTSARVAPYTFVINPQQMSLASVAFFIVARRFFIWLFLQTKCFPAKLKPFTNRSPTLTPTPKWICPHGRRNVTPSVRCGGDTWTAAPAGGKTRAVGLRHESQTLACGPKLVSNVIMFGPAMQKSLLELLASR